VSGGIALVGIDHFVIYLGFDTVPVSPGASPVTFTPGVGGGGFPLLHVLQVSSCLDIPLSYSTNVIEGD